MPIVRTPIIDDSGSGQDGTVLDNAWKQELYDQIDAFGGGAATVLISNTTGTVHDWSLPGQTGNTLIRWEGTADLTITGFQFPTATGFGTRITILNYGTGIIWCPHYAAGSAYRLLNVATSAATPIARGGYATYVLLDVYAWHLVGHEQGSWIAPPYLASNFTGNGGTWTVAAGDIYGFRYRLAGKSLTIGFVLNSTSVAAGSSQLFIMNAAYGGFANVAGNYQDGPLNWLEAATSGAGYIQANPSDTKIGLLKNKAAATWAATTDNTFVSSTFMMEIV